MDNPTFEVHGEPAKRMICNRAPPRPYWTLSDILMECLRLLPVYFLASQRTSDLLGSDSSSMES